MKTENRATPLFTATAFVAISAALFFLSGCSADTSVAGASEEESAVSYEVVNQGTALAKSKVSPESVEHGEFTDPRDGQKYRTVKIGNNTWFAQNLNFETANSWCYNDEEANCEEYGRLYTHADAANACPEGWDLPSTIEYVGLYMNTTTSFNGQISNVAMLVASGTVDAKAKDEFGFSLLFAGARTGDGKFESAGSETFLWTSTGKDTAGRYVAQKIGFWSDRRSLVEHNWAPKGNSALSVRCIKR